MPVSGGIFARVRRAAVPSRLAPVGSGACAVVLAAAVALAGAAHGRAASLADDPAFALYRQAVEAMERKDYPEARRLAAAAIAEYPGHLLAHYLAGQAALSESRWSEAADAFATVTALYPRSFAGHRDHGIALAELGRPDEATRAWETALALRDDEDVRVRLAFLLLERGAGERARPHLAALADRGTTRPEVWTALGRLHYEAGDLPAAARAFARAADLRDDGRTWFNLAVIRLRLADRPGAVAALERAALHPDMRDQARRELDRLKSAPLDDAVRRQFGPLRTPTP
jgi:tetratricopeptide (TPR) repeat protein